MKVQTTRFGELEVTKDKMFTFPEGLLGFDWLREFSFVPVEDNPAFRWLQSLEEPDVAFLLCDPFMFFSDYEVKLDDKVSSELEIAKKEDVLVKVIATVPKTGIKNMTVNLVGPVVFNVKKRFGKQIVLQNSEYGTRHKVFTNTGDKGKIDAAQGG